ncbi:MAG: hypothetical protein QOC71_2085 [Thermoplasmata archaeon]|jgi:hypothetical protein|nr:hypothetical protein [Thermoplasmata archaeon]
MTGGVKPREINERLMDPVRASLALLALALLVGAMPTQAQLANPNQSTPTTLYFHIFDTFNAFPINTQPMDVEFFEVGGTNFPTASHTIVSQQVGDYDFNTIYGFSTSGPVEYDFIENGHPRFHPERGIAADVQVDPSVQPVVYLYMDVRDMFSTDAGDPALGLPQFLPSFTFRYTMRTGNQVGPDSNLDAGQLLMSGQMTAHVVDTHAAGQNGLFAGMTAPDGTPVFIPDEAGVVEFAIPLTVSNPVIPKADSFNVRIDWYQNPSGDAAQDDSVAEGWMRLISDAQHLPRLQLAVMNPVYIEYIHPEVAAGILLIHSCVNSPWGTYDVDVANITVAVDGPTAPSKLQQVISQNSHVHGLHDKCAEVTYLWRFRDEDAKNGDYAIQLDVPNMAKSSLATGQAGFSVEGKKAYGIDEGGEVVEPAAGSEGKTSPMPVAPAVALLVVGLAALARRRSA